MSDTGSDPEAESGGRSANARAVARPSYASLQRLNLEPLITDKSWQANNESGFHNTVVRQYRFSHDLEGVPRSYQPPDSDTMSMAVAAHSDITAIGSSVSVASSAYSPYPPSLGSFPSVASGYSVRTSNADEFLVHDLLERSENGTLERPTVPNGGSLGCAYSFLGCSFGSSSFPEWDTHCQSHFCGHLPTKIDCPFRCDWTHTAPTGEEAWACRNAHIASAHSTSDAVDTTRRPGQVLLAHLWRYHIVDDAQLEELRMCGRLTDDNIFLRSAGRLRDRRRERRTRQ